MKIKFKRYHKSGVIYKEMDDYFITRIFRFFSIPLALKFSNRGISPSKITLFSLIFGLGSIFSFALDFPYSNRIAAVLYALFILADMVDGDVARISGKSSIIGEWYDSVTGKLIQPAVFIGIAFAVARAYPEKQIWLITSFIILGFYIFGMIRNKSNLLILRTNKNKPQNPPVHQDFILNKNIIRVIVRDISTTYAIWIFIIIGGLSDQLYYAILVTSVHVIYTVARTIFSSWKIARNL